ncbi:hypothetical protein PAMP_005477 [Pampus punctatissimus]
MFWLQKTGAKKTPKNNNKKNPLHTGESLPPPPPPCLSLAPRTHVATRIPIMLIRARVCACSGSKAGMSLRAIRAWRVRRSVTELQLPRGAGAEEEEVCGAVLRN